MKLSTPLDQHEKICLEALDSLKRTDMKSYVRKPLCGRLKHLITQIILLHLVLPIKINFTQMERYGTHTEKTYRLAQLEKMDRMKVNMSLMRRVFKDNNRIAIAINPSYIYKSGKCPPRTSMFWSGCGFLQQDIYRQFTALWL